MKEQLKHIPILLFDGYCNFCNSTIRFIVEREKNNALHFTSLQSGAGIELLKQYGIDPLKTDSLVLIEKGKAYVKSSAALRVTRYLKRPYPLLLGLIIIPAFLRNGMYDFIAGNRYKWFGKSESCMLPDKELAKRFL